MKNVKLCMGGWILLMTLLFTGNTNTWAQEYKEVAVFKSADVIKNAQNYSEYQNENWYISKGGGGGNNSVGFNKTASNQTLIGENNLGTQANGKNYGVHVKSKTKLNNVSKVIFTNTSGTGGTGKIYLAASTDGETWKQVEGTEGQVLSVTNNITFTFNTIDAAYFGVVLDRGKTSGADFRFNNVVMTFYALTGDPNKKNTKLTFAQESYNFNVGTGDKEIVDIPVLTEDGIDTPTIKGATITYTSSNEDIAIVEEGHVFVVTDAAGTATITAEYAGDDTYNGCKAEYTINVNKVATSIAFDKGDVTYTVGDENNAAVYENPAILTPVSAGMVTYKSSDDAAADVDETGAVLVNTSKPGIYTITASYAGNDSYEASEASYTITVKKPFYSGAENYVKIDSNDDLAGKYIIIGPKSTGENFILTTLVSNKSGYYYDSYTTILDNNQIKEIPEDAGSYAVFSLIGNTNNGYAFYNTTTEKYLKVTGENTTSLSEEVDETNATYATIAFNDGKGNQEVMFKCTGNKPYLRFNANAKRFSSYGNSGSEVPIQLFRHGYARDVTSGNFGTLCLPYGGTISGATLYAIEGKQMENGEVKSISLTEVEKAEAGVPYIFQATAEKLVVYYEGDIKTTAAGNNGLIGSYNGTAVKAGNYVISNNTVKKCGDGSKIGTNRCYINMDQVHEADASAAALVISFNDTTDAIESIEAGADSRNAIYDLSGRRVKAAKKGLYIVNGKKIIK